MADQDSGAEDTGADGGGAETIAEESAPRLTMLAQYVKDLSFENPNAPQSMVAGTQPEIEVTVDVQTRRLDPERYETTLKVNISARQESSTMFIVELLYGGLFGIQNVPDEQLGPYCMIECPRQLFPFARRIIADATRDGGFPPLMLEPVDFVQLYKSELDRRQAGETATV